MSSKFDSLKQKNAANIQKMEQATNLTIVDSEQWAALINTVKNLNEQMNMNRQEVQITATEQNLNQTKQAVQDQTKNLKTVLDTASKSMTDSIAEQTEVLSQQAGNQNEQFGLQMNNLAEATSDIKKKLIPLLIGITSAVQVLFLTAYILLEIFLK